MKFLIQKFPAGITHDFAFTLIESIRYNNWLHEKEHDKKMGYRLIKYTPDCFKEYHKKYIPIGSVEFVTAFLQHFYNITPKPKNVPEELMKHPSFDFVMRQIANGNHMDFEMVVGGKYFVKSNTQIKGFAEMVEIPRPMMLPLPAGEYQVSQFIQINSEWRAFVYQGKLVGLQNYSGDFTLFPSVGKIEEMILAYKSAPVAYTLDIGVRDELYHPDYGFHVENETFVIEVHDFFSCGLYGFADHKILPYMFSRWFNEYIKTGK